MENEVTTKTPIPAHRKSLFWILSPVSCLLPYPPIDPSLPRIHRSSVVHLTNVQLLCVLCDLCGLKPFLQNKPNVKMGKMTISIATIKAYANKQRTMNNERYSKQSQFKPNLVAAEPRAKPDSPAPLLRRERIQNLGAKRISRSIGPASKIENPVSRIQHRVSSIKNPASLRKTKPISNWAI